MDNIKANLSEQISKKCETTLTELQAIVNTQGEAITGLTKKINLTGKQIDPRH